MTTVTKYAKQVSQTQSNPPYANWMNLSALQGEEYNNTICNVGNVTPLPAPVKASNFNFNIPSNSKINKININYEVHIDNTGAKVSNPQVSCGCNKFRSTINNSGTLTSKINKQKVSFARTGELLNNITATDINDDSFGVWLDFKNLNNTTRGIVYLTSIQVTIEYESPQIFYLNNTETNENFPTENIPKEIELNDTIEYGLKFVSETGDGVVKTDNGYEGIIVNVDIPYGLQVVGSYGNGTFNTKTNTWKPEITNTAPVYLTLILKAYGTGLVKLKSKSNCTGSTYDYYVHINGKSPNTQRQVEDITVSMPQIMENTLNTNIEVLIESTARTTCCFEFESTCTNQPFDFSKIVIVTSENINLENPYTVNGNKICFNKINPNEHFYIVLSIPFRVIGDSKTEQSLKISNNDFNEEYTETFYVYEHEPIIGLFSTDEIKYEYSSFHAGQVYGTTDAPYSPDELLQFIAWAGCEEDYYVKDGDLGAIFEKIYGYFGPIKLSRTHANARTDVSNSKIKEQYQNRVHYGKVGDYTESRTGTLRLKPQEVATLMGLCQLDKPIAIDCEPLMSDGNPLIWRGWAELFSVKSIQKINPNLYECTPDLEFLTKDVNTRFNVERLDAIRDYNLPNILETTLFPLDSMDNYFNIGGNGTYNSKLINSNVLYDIYDFHNLIEVETGKTLSFTSKNTIAPSFSLTLDWLNTLIADVDQPYPDWTLALRLLDAKTNKLVFEYDYYNFKHRVNNEVVNKCNARIIARKYDKYKVWNFADLYLEWGNKVKATELDIQLATELWNVTKDMSGNQYLEDGEDSVPENVTFTDIGHYIEAKLIANIDGAIIPAVNEIVVFKLTRLSNGLSKEYEVMTDNRGVARIPIYLANASYKCSAYFKETKDYLGSSMSEFTFNMNTQRTETSIKAHNYDGKTQYTVGGNTLVYPKITSTGEKIEAQLWNEIRNTGISNEQIEFEIVDNTNVNRRRSYYQTTDSNGKASLEINLDTGDYSVYLKYNGNSIYQPAPTQQINLVVQLDGKGTITKIIGKDETFKIWGKEHIITLVDYTGKPIEGEHIDFMLGRDNTNSTQWYYNQAKTDKNGQTSLPINLADGCYYITAIFNGSKTNANYPDGLKPSTVTNTIISNQDKLTNTSISLDNDDGEIFTTSGQGISGVLYEYLDDTTTRTLSGKTITLTAYYESDTNLTNKSNPVITTTDSQGKFFIPINLHDQDYYAILTYDGDLTHNNSYQTIHFTTAFKSTIDGTKVSTPSTSLKFANEMYTIEGQTSIIMTLKDAEGNPLSGKQIYVTEYESDSGYLTETVGKTYPTTNIPIPLTDSNGQTSITVNYTTTSSVRYGKLKAQFKGESGKYQESNDTTKLYITQQATNSSTNPDGKTVDEDNNIVNHNPGANNVTLEITECEDTYTSRENKNIIATLKHGSTPLQNMSVQLLFRRYKNNSVEYSFRSDIKQTNSSGQISVPMQLSNNSYDVQAIFGGDNQFENKTSDIKAFKVNVPNTAVKPDIKFVFKNSKGEVVNNFNKYTNLNSGDKQVQVYLYNANTNTPLQNRVLYFKATDIHDPIRTDERDYNTYYAVTDQDGKWIWNIWEVTGDFEIQMKYKDPNNDYNEGSGTCYVSVSTALTNSLVETNTINTYDDDGNLIKYFNNVKLSELNAGSSLNIELQNGNIRLRDYGLSNDNNITAPKIDFSTDIDIGDYILQLEVKNPQVAESTLLKNQAVISQLWMQIMENTTQSKYLPLYQNMIISPLALPKRACVFIRKTEDGILHYYDYNPYGDIDYLGDPRNQFEGGVDLQTEDGYSVVDTESGYNPIAICNGLIKVVFDRIGHFIKFYRYDANHDLYIFTQGVYIEETPNINLEHYSDDKIVLSFGHTRWTVWRGHPFVQVEHPHTELTFLRDLNRVNCEIAENTHLGFPTEQTIRHGEFNTYYSPNLFNYDYHLNDDFKLDNFQLYSSKNTTQLSWADRRTDGNRTELIIDLDPEETYAEVLFPNPSLMEIPENPEFNLLLGNIFASKECDIKITCNLYGEEGRVQATNDPDPSNHTGKKLTTTTKHLNSGDNKLNINFTIPSDLREWAKYMDFTITINNTSNERNIIGICRFMCYEGYNNEEVVFTEANPGEYYDKTKVFFKNTYYCSTYNKGESYGTCIIKPEYDSINLGNVPPSDTTVFAPFFRNSQKWDKPELVALEYMTFHDQKTIVNRVD